MQHPLREWGAWRAATPHAHPRVSGAHEHGKACSKRAIREEKERQSQIAHEGRRPAPIWSAEDWRGHASPFLAKGAKGGVGIERLCFPGRGCI
jgi:hypothetical protein